MSDKTKEDKTKKYDSSVVALGTILGLIGGYVGGMLMGMGIYSSVHVCVPATPIVQKGFVKPSELELELKDHDENGKRELILTYNNKPYYLTLNEQGRPVIRPYKVKITPRKVNVEVYEETK
jgi:hypothetical protein